MTKTAWLFACFLACGSSAPKANPCATPGATYLDHFVEQSGGTCGAIPDTIININPDGTVATTASVSCATKTQTGCTARDSGCTVTTNGTTCTVTTDITYAADGTSATGLESLSCTTGNQTCTSSYSVASRRQ